MNNKLICEYCSQEFSSLKKLTYHLNIKHYDKGLNIEENCKNPNCKEKIIFRKYNEIETIHNNYCCRDCYYQHIKTCRKKDIVCKSCGDIFTSITKYKYHIKTKCKTKNYICDFCSKTFLNSNSQKRHLKQQHKDKQIIKKIKCLNANCNNLIEVLIIGDSEFNYNKCCSSQCVKELNSQRLTKEDIYICNLCGRKFKTENALKKHENKNHTNNLYQCEFCYASYNTITTLHKHYTLQHIDKKIEEDIKCENPKCDKLVKNEKIGNFSITKKRFCTKKCARVYSYLKGVKLNKLNTYAQRRIVTFNYNGCKWFDFVDKQGNKHRVQGTYELAFAKKMDELNINFISHPHGIKYTKNNKTVYYFPDFYIPSKNLYIDTKAKYYFENSKEKFHLIREQLPSLNLLILTEKFLFAFGITEDRNIRNKI